eukprot:TRINITY_DN121114_c0_g1_i1.p2 TRINITY_DN121114_c0_g1~~TRINITY_DN121114_c0_g1_i1.p2  ORF type:complete len:267 (+),score=81.64 TRINITY_DN121114_c0_g1_i1:72-872(+)
MVSSMGGAAAAGLPLKRGAEGNAGSADKASRKGEQKPRATQKAAASSSVTMDAATNQIMSKMMKLTLQNSREIANLKSLNILTVVFLKDSQLGSAVIEKTKLAAKGYSDAVKALSPEEKSKYHSPHIYIWLELQRAVYEHCKSVTDPAQQEAAQKIIKALDKVEQDFAREQRFKAQDEGIEETLALREVIASWVGMCKVSKCYSQQHMKVELGGLGGSPGREACQLVCRALCLFAGGQKKTGMSPKNDLERKIAEFLDRQTRNEGD